RGFVSADILTHWPAIVGTDLAAYACPLEVRFPRNRNAGATLVLRVANGAAATLLHLKTPVVGERVNRFFGYGAVARVEAGQGPPVDRRPARPASRREEPIRDAANAAAVVAAVGAALSYLGAACARLRRTRQG